MPCLRPPFRQLWPLPGTVWLARANPACTPWSTSSRSLTCYTSSAGNTRSSCCPCILERDLYPYRNRRASHSLARSHSSARDCSPPGLASCAWAGAAPEAEARAAPEAQALGRASKHRPPPQQEWPPRWRPRRPLLHRPSQQNTTDIAMAVTIHRPGPGPLSRAGGGCSPHGH